MSAMAKPLHDNWQKWLFNPPMKRSTARYGKMSGSNVQARPLADTAVSI
jgi:hypothetical protein